MGSFCFRDPCPALITAKIIRPDSGGHHATARFGSGEPVSNESRHRVPDVLMKFKTSTQHQPQARPRLGHLKLVSMSTATLKDFGMKKQNTTLQNRMFGVSFITNGYSRITDMDSSEGIPCRLDANKQAFKEAEQEQQQR
jgi:hypothetical protein